MQCPETPRHACSGSFPTPPSSTSTTFTSATVRRRRKIKTPASEDTPSRSRSLQGLSLSTRNGSLVSSTDNTSISTPCGEIVQEGKTLFSQGNTDDVFQASEDHTRRQSTLAISRFRKAAKRLALSELSSNHQASKRPKSSQFSNQVTPQKTASRSNLSRLSTRDIKPATPIKTGQVEERDITSAWGKSVNAALRQIGTPSTPLQRKGTRNVKNATNYTPCSTTVPQQTSVSGTRNFSRPGARLPSTETKRSRSSSHSGRQARARGMSAATATSRAQTTGFGHRLTPASTSRSSRISSIIDDDEHTRASFENAVSEELGDKRKELQTWEVWAIRIAFTLFVFAANIALGLAYLGNDKHPYLLAILAFMKSKDILSTGADIIGLLYTRLHRLVWPPRESKPQWILSLVTAYAETEQQIMKTVLSLAKSDLQKHKQVICIIMDGKPRDVLSKMSGLKIATQRPYTTWRGARGDLRIYAGYIEETPTLLMEKVKNAGKKDSLILGHDLFNYPRDDMARATKLLRQEVWQKILPTVTRQHELNSFGHIFCTDADSTIHQDALRRLADALGRERNTIAACGVLFAEFGDKWYEWSPWHLFQQFQYTFGQYVRRQAESTWGRVTCLPGCITMITVRPEMGAAVSQYAKAVTEHNLFRHQVQYLGTDRRLTWCMISQDKHLRTIFVPDALSETVVPNSFSHYVSQRRRWASNAYFNDMFYALGPQQRLITRLFALIDIIRLTLVFYRVFNTGYFLHGLITNFYVVKILPTLIVTKTPALWYLILTMTKERHLRRRMHKVVLGMLINQLISPLLSVFVFFNVLLNMGSQAWGRTGVSTQKAEPAPVPVRNGTEWPRRSWTPRSLARSVHTAIHGLSPVARRDATPRAAALSPLRNTRDRGASEDSADSQAAAVPQTPFAQGVGAPKPNTTASAVESSAQSMSRVRSVSGSTAVPTSFSLLRRTPYHRQHSATNEDGVVETPTRSMPQQPRSHIELHES